MYMPKPGELMSEYMGANVKKLLKHCGENVMIFPMAKVVYPEVVEIGDNSRLCDYVFVHPGKKSGKGYKIGRYTDIEPFSLLWGGGEIVVGDFVNISPHVTLFSSSFNYKDGGFTSSVTEEQFSSIHYGSIIIGDHAFIGTNSTITVDVHIGQGAVVGANSFVNKDLEAWSVYVGNPLKKIGERPKDVLKKAEKILK